MVHQAISKHNLYCTRTGTVQYAVSDCGTSTRTIVSLYISDLLNVIKSTREDSCLRAASPCDRRTNERTNTQQSFLKSGGCTDNAEKTTQDMIRKIHEIEGRSQPTTKHNMQSQPRQHGSPNESPPAWPGTVPYSYYSRIRSAQVPVLVFIRVLMD